jgi:hypothetical protein
MNRNATACLRTGCGRRPAERVAAEPERKAHARELLAMASE